jgi:hypothetical protein
MKYHILDSIDELTEFPKDSIVFDLETSSLENYSPDTFILGIGYCWNYDNAYYINLPKPGKEYDIELKKNYDLILSKYKLWGHNLKFDVRMLNKYKYDLHNNIEHDSYIITKSLFCELIEANLDDLTYYFFNHKKIRTSHLMRKLKPSTPKSMQWTPSTLIGYYCCEDVEFTYRLIRMYIEEYL